MEGIRKMYERTLRQMAYNELEEARAKSWTNIVASINKDNSFKLGANRYAEEIQREN